MIGGGGVGAGAQEGHTTLQSQFAGQVFLHLARLESSMRKHVVSRSAQQRLLWHVLCLSAQVVSGGGGRGGGGLITSEAQADNWRTRKTTDGPELGPCIFTRTHWARRASSSRSLSPPTSTTQDWYAWSIGAQSMGLRFESVTHVFSSKLVCSLKYSGCVSRLK